MTGDRRGAGTAPGQFWLTSGSIFLGQGSFHLVVGLVGFGHDPNTFTVMGAVFVVVGMALLSIRGRSVARRGRRAVEPDAQVPQILEVPEVAAKKARQRRALAVVGLVYAGLAVASLVHEVVTGTRADGVQVVTFGVLGLVALYLWRRGRRLSRVV